jgi:hypothetical protein
VDGARYLWLLRAATLLVVLALLLDPGVPWPGTSGLTSRWVLLDASESMAAGDEGATAWIGAVRRAEALGADGWRVVTFGAEIDQAPEASDLAPTEPTTRLGPALSVAAESGAREIRVLTDMRIEDMVAVRAALEGSRLDITFENLAEPVENAGILSLDVGDRASPTAAGVAVVELHGGVAGDSLSVQVLEEGVPVGSSRVEAPGQGLRRRVEIDLPPSAGTGAVRFEALVSGVDDDFAADDRAVAYGLVGAPQDAGVVLVSLGPDWEPRYLLPVLERTTGLPASGFLRAGPDRYVSMGAALERAGPVDSATVRRAAEGASLLVLHGLSEDTDAWVRGLIARAPRSISFASDAAGASLLGIDASAPRAGEWYLGEEIPASPLSGELAALAGADLPPLTGVMIAQDATGLVAPLSVSLRRTGPAEAPIHLRSNGVRRSSVVLARGFWRWAARPDDRAAYETLWSGVAGWLLRDASLAGAEVRPAARVVPAGEPVPWQVPEARAGATVGVRPDTATTTEEARALTLDGSGTVFTEPLAPGPYRYTVRDPAGDSVAGGRFDVSDRSTDMFPAPVDPARLVSERAGAAADAGGTRPLRTLPWPYLLIIGLLCAEWIGRRRSGLR